MFSSPLAHAICRFHSQAAGIVSYGFVSLPPRGYEDGAVAGAVVCLFGGDVDCFLDVTGVGFSGRGGGDADVFQCAVYDFCGDYCAFILYHCFCFFAGYLAYLIGHRLS